MKSSQQFSSTMKAVFAHLSLAAFMGFFILGALLEDPSQGGGFLGFSTGRWGILLVNLLILAGILISLYKVWIGRSEKLEIWLSSRRHLFWLLFITLVVFGTSLPAGLGLIPAIRYFKYFGRIQPSLLWLAFVSCAIFLNLSVVLRTSILCWFRQFFPLGKTVNTPVILTILQRNTMLGIALVYVLLQAASHLQVHDAIWLSDSIDYIFPAEKFSWTNPGLWTYTKPWGTAVLYKIVGSSPVTIDAVQTITSALAWLLLAWVFSRVIRKNWLRIVTFVLILSFSLSPPVQMWNHIIQSESLSISLMVLILAVWLSLLQRWRRGKLITLILLYAWWIGTRETNVYLGLLVAGFLLFVGLVYKHQRFYWAISVLLVLFGYINMQISEIPTLPRWLYPLTNTVLKRILPNDEFLGYFEAKGLPVSEKLLSLSGGFANSENFAMFNHSALDEVERWLYKRGKDVYIRFLIDHPVYTLTSPWIHVRELLTPRELLSYAPDQYAPLLAWFFGGLFFLGSLWLLLLIELVTLVVTMVAKPWRCSPTFWLVLGFFALFFPHFYLVWHGDAAEVGRHAIQASVQLRLALWLLFLLALDKIVDNG